MRNENLFLDAPQIEVGTIVFDEVEACSGTVIEVYQNWTDFIANSKSHIFYKLEDGEEVVDDDFYVDYLNSKLSDLETGDLEERWLTLCNYIDNVWWAPESQLHVISSPSN